MTNNNQTFTRLNGTYDVSAAMDRAALLQRRSEYVRTGHGFNAMARATRRLWALGSKMTAPVGALKTRVR